MTIANKNNNIQISDDVLSSIVEIAINEIDGAKTVEPSFTDKITKHSFIEIITEDGLLTVNASISVKFDTKLLEIISAVQTNIASNLEVMTSFKVKQVNISVVSLFN